MTSFAFTPSSHLLLLLLPPPKRRLCFYGRLSSAGSMGRSTSPTLISSNSQSRNRFVILAHSGSTGHVGRSKDSLLELAILLFFSLVLLCLRLFHGVLLPCFPRRWRDLAALSGAAESRGSTYPAHLWQAVVAYEDRRFFSHFGVDPIGIARAAASFSARGGGSTITQQLVKNVFLKNERTLTRKIVEMALALAVERTLSKQQILSSYVSEIYWGHGIYGIESASLFYFGKHPSLLSFGESAMLVAMIPAPELRSPFRDPSSGVFFQVRVLRRMVEFGFLDVEMALQIVKQSLHLSSEGPKSADGSSKEDVTPSGKVKHKGTDLTIGSIWDWETESKIWEAREDMEKWAMEFRCSEQTKCSSQRFLYLHWQRSSPPWPCSVRALVDQPDETSRAARAPNR